MKADSLPEEPNNLNSQASEETNAPDALQPADIPLTSETLASEESTPQTVLPPAEVPLTEPLASQESETSEVLHPSDTAIAQTAANEELNIQDAPDFGEISWAETVASGAINAPEVPPSSDTAIAQTRGSEEVEIQDALNPGETFRPEPVANDEIGVPEALHPSDTAIAQPVVNETINIQDAPNPVETPLLETVASQEIDAPDVPDSLETLFAETVASEARDTPDVPDSTATPLPETAVSQASEPPETSNPTQTPPSPTFSYWLTPWGTPRETSSQAIPSTEAPQGAAGGKPGTGLPYEPSSRRPPEITPTEAVISPGTESDSDEYPFDPDKKNTRIFITGASGCIGHYITETLIRETDYELYLLVRDPEKLHFDCNARPGIHVMQGDMRDLGRFRRLLKTIDYAVLVAAAWGGQRETLDINVLKPIQLLESLDPKVCQQVIYFSTASVLDKNNEVLKEAVQLGTDYIRTKADFLRRVSRLPIAKRMTVLFPTLVLGGDDHHPYSHLSGGLPGITKWIDLIRWFKADASFHFIHGKDIAEVVRYLLDHPPSPQDSRWLVLGNPSVTVNQAVEEACAYLNRRIFFRLPLSFWLANLFIALFNIQMSAWDRFCLEQRNFTYQNPVNPATFGLPVYCSTFTDVLKISGVSESRE